MQYKPHEDANKREHAPQQSKGMAQKKPDMYREQEDQWAVLRHEVEDEDMKRQAERSRPDWEQRNTEDDAIRSQAFLDAEYEEAPNQVDIVVAGIGGGGMNAVNRMISRRVRGVRFVAMNTDAQVLSLSASSQRICLGQRYTKGLGAGGNAAVGARAAAESEAEIQAVLNGANLVFIAAGMGGGTGTGGAPVVASIAKKLGALTVGIVTLPFAFEGRRRRRIAEDGLVTLGAEIDALITVPNDRLLAVTGKDRSLADAFKLADDVLRQGVQGIAEVINVPGLVNVDFADVRSVLREAGTALMSIGQGQGRNRAQIAAQEAIAGGFLNVTIRGAQRVLFNISGGEDMTLFEVNEVAEYIGNAIDNTADITFGAVIDPALDDVIRVTLIAAGMEELRTRRIPAIHLEQSHTPSVASSHAGASSPAFSSPPKSPYAQSVGNIVQPSPAQQRPGAVPASPAQMPKPPMPRAAGSSGTGRPPASTARPQRSLDDLRGLRDMGRRQGQQLPHGKSRQTNDEDAVEDIGVDTPPFIKRYH
ncbi:MAG TPA: cell division protein FtsZ [Ktedonobacteraceae bacterium]|nr:cell division protein FtsZ [Ktedonobacteraceae bacterium]